MKDFIEYILINSIEIFGFWVLFQPGMIFFRIGNSLESKVNLNWRWIFKPVFVCPPCMASLHGIVGFYLTGMDWFILPLYLVALTGLNYVVNQMLHG